MWFPATRLHFPHGELVLEGLNFEHAEILANAFTPEITRWLLMPTQPTLIEEEDLISKVGDSKNPDVYAGVFLDGVLVGGMGLRINKGKHASVAEGGKFIFHTSAWGKGISTAISQARLVYLFNSTLVEQIQTEVALPNVGSWWSLVKAGYRITGVEWAAFMDHFTGIKVPMLRMAAYRPHLWKQRSAPCLHSKMEKQLLTFLKGFPGVTYEQMEKIPGYLDQANLPLQPQTMALRLEAWATNMTYL